jgi:hypothetical protein
MLLTRGPDNHYDFKNNMSLRVDLESRKDELYLGTLFVGSPKS